MSRCSSCRACSILRIKGRFYFVAVLFQLFEIKFNGEHKLAWADVDLVGHYQFVGRIHTDGFVELSVRDIQPFEFEVHFFLDPSILVRKIIKRVPK